MRGVVLFVGCLAVVLASPTDPQLRTQNAIDGKGQNDDLVAMAPLVAETENKPANANAHLNVVHDAFSRVVRSLADKGNVLDDKKDPTIIKLNGNTAVITLGTDPTSGNGNRVDMNMLVTFEDDITFVYKEECKDTGCVKDQNKITKYYSDAGGKLKPETDKNGEIDYTYTFPSSDMVTAKIYKDQAEANAKLMSTAFKFAAIYKGNDSTKDGLAGNLDGRLGLGFPPAGATYQFDTIDALFGPLDKDRKYITVLHDAKDANKAIIALGVNQYEGCNYKRTTNYTALYTAPDKSRHWYFYADSIITGTDTKDDGKVLVKLDPFTDSIGLPKKYMDLINSNGGKTSDSSVSDFNKLPNIRLKVKDFYVNINNTVLTSDDQKKLVVTTQDDTKDFKIVLGTPFFRHFCVILNQDSNVYQVAFTIPDEKKFAHVNSISFVALALIPLANLLRF